MNYQRQMIDGSALLFGMPEIEKTGMQFYKRPELPKVKFKCGRVTYTITDVRLLNESAINTLLVILNECATQPNVKEVSFKVNDGTEQGTIDAICDIITGIDYSVKKGGRNGFESNGTFISTGYDYTESENGINTIKFHIIEQHAKAIYDYTQKVGVDSLRWYDIVVLIADESHKNIEELTRMIKEGELK